MHLSHFPDAPYYAQYLCVSFQQQIKIAPELLPYVDSYYRMLQLSGKQITPELIELLLSAIRRGEVYNLYLSPFLSSSETTNNNERFRMIDQWSYDTYTHGCGAVIFNQEKSIAFMKIIDEHAKNYIRRRQAGDILLAHPPVIFESPDELAAGIANLILTGSLEDGKEQPPAPSDSRVGVDPNLLYWMENIHQSVPEHLEELSKLNGLFANFFVPGYPKFPDWLASDPGNWSLLGELPNLKSLFFPELSLENYDFLLKCTKLQKLSLAKTNFHDVSVLKHLSHLTDLDLPPAEFSDFSFLLDFKELEILDVSQTNFRDCSLLAQIPSLKLVYLPAKRQLLHTECLEALPMQVKCDPTKVRGEEIDPFEIIEPGPVENWDLKPPYKVLYIDGGPKDLVEGLEITQDYIKALQKMIKKGNEKMIYISLSPYGEGDALQLDTAEGWAALSYEEEESSVWYTLYNPKHAKDRELAPPEGGGQSPIPKMHATQDLELVANCVAYFIKTGKLYPGAYWAKYYE